MNSSTSTIAAHRSTTNVSATHVDGRAVIGINQVANICVLIRGHECFTILWHLGIDYGYAGENIAMGQRTPEIVMNDWMNSSGHRANILSENFDCIGVGYTMVDGHPYWVQLFTGDFDL